METYFRKAKLYAAYLITLKEIQLYTDEIFVSVFLCYS